VQPLHKAREMPNEEFKREVEKELNGKESEPSEIICPLIEQAIETVALMWDQITVAGTA